MLTSELKNAALDWAVAKCQDIHLTPHRGGWAYAAYSTNWAQGGPIIERERIAVEFLQWDDIDCVLPIWTSYKFGTDYEGQGPTTLIAAMRCYVSSKLGDDVEIPKELQ